MGLRKRLMHSSLAGQMPHNLEIMQSSLPVSEVDDELIDICILRKFPIGAIPKLLSRLFNKKVCITPNTWKLSVAKK